MLTRRNFNLGLTSAAFGGLALTSCNHFKKLPDYLQRIPGFRDRKMRRLDHYGALVDDTEGLLDLPNGFSYTIISPRGPGPKGHGAPPLKIDGAFLDKADGMGSFRSGNNVVLVRNHESSTEGGTSTLLYDFENDVVLEEYRSLEGTLRNCAGGATPWGTWLSCEEDLTPGHGFVYEVPALRNGLVRREPLTRLGRFNHEAAAVDPVTKITYMTEDQIDSIFYRFVPQNVCRPLDEGKLQALVFADSRHGADSRNWEGDWAVEEWREVRWETLSDYSWGLNDPRKRAYRELQAVRFACGEGIHFGDSELYFTATSGGRIKSGQIMRYRPATGPGERDQLQIFLESTDPGAINFADNLVVAPNGHLIVCEDPYWGGEKTYMPRLIDSSAPCYLRGVTPEGDLYNLARLRNGSELAGACFSPDGKILFLNVYSPAKTLAIRGEWKPGPRPEWGLYEAGTGRVICA